MLLLEECILSRIITKKRIIKLTDSSFDLRINNNNKKKWFIVFYTNTCAYCETTLHILENEILPHYENDTTIEFGIINCNDNTWLPLRFNITYIPYSILIDISTQQMFEYKYYNTFDFITSFIDYEHINLNASSIPPKYTYITRTKILLIQSYNEIKVAITHILQYYNLNINISDYILVPLFIICIIFVWKIQSLFINKIKLLFNNRVNI